MAKRRTPGVFCLEGPWSSRLTDKSSVRPLLELLENRGEIRFIHRDAATQVEFETCVKQWTQKQYSAYSFGYFAFHGEAGAIWIGKNLYPLADLGVLLKGRLGGRTVYLGSCETLHIDHAEVEAFRRVTSARAVCGYTTEVDWIETAAFELNLIYAVTYYERIDAGFRYLLKHHGGACERLGLRAVWNGGSAW